MLYYYLVLLRIKRRTKELKFSDIVACFFTYRNEASKRKTSVNETRQLAMTTEKVTAMLLQILDGNTNTEVQNT